MPPTSSTCLFAFCARSTKSSTATFERVRKGSKTPTRTNVESIGFPAGEPPVSAVKPKAPEGKLRPMRKPQASAATAIAL